MYTLCRSQFLPCALIMAALTAGIFMLFYCLRKKPMWVTACVLLLIVGSWVSGTIAGQHECRRRIHEFPVYCFGEF